MNTVAGFLLLVLAGAAFNAAKSGQLRPWLAGFFTNAHAPKPVDPGKAAAGAGVTGSSGAGSGSGGGNARAVGALRTVAGVQLAEPYASRVAAAVEAAARDGVQLVGSSGYRSNGQQIALRRAHGCGNGREYDPTCLGSPRTAVPGRSRHETGEAIDFANMTSRTSPGYRWLERNGAAFGMVNFPPEPWHWSTDGH